MDLFPGASNIKTGVSIIMHICNWTFKVLNLFIYIFCIFFLFQGLLRRVKRVFCCCSVCERMEDYKEEYLMVWTNYTCMSPCNSISGLYFEDTCDIISVTMAMHKVLKKGPLNFSFL